MLRKPSNKLPPPRVALATARWAFVFGVATTSGLFAAELTSQIKLFNSAGHLAAESEAAGTPSAYFAFVAEDGSTAQACNGFFLGRTQTALVGATAAHCLKRAREAKLTSFFALTYSAEGKSASLPLHRILFEGQLSDDPVPNADLPVLDLALIEFSCANCEAWPTFADPREAETKKALALVRSQDIEVLGYEFSPGEDAESIVGKFTRNRCQLHVSSPRFYLLGPTTTELPSPIHLSLSGRDVRHDREHAVFFDGCALPKGRSGSLLRYQQAPSLPLAVLSHAVTSSWVWKQIKSDAEVEIPPSPRLLYQSTQGKNFLVRNDAERFVFGSGARLTSLPKE